MDLTYVALDSVVWKEWRLYRVFACQTGRTSRTVNGNEGFEKGFILKCSAVSERGSSPWKYGRMALVCDLGTQG